jgi:hypothetical protein
MARQQISLVPVVDNIPAGGEKINANFILCDADTASIAGAVTTANSASVAATAATSGLATTNTTVAGHTVELASHASSIAGFNQILAPIFPSGDTSGVTDFANFAAAFAVMAADTTGLNHILTISTGIYYTNAKLVFTFNIAGQGNLATPYEFRGQGGVRIVQVTSNTGILEFQVPLGGFPSNVKISGIQFEAQTQQTSANTGSFGIGARAIATTATNETTWGYLIEYCRFQNLYRGISNTQPAGIFPWWGIMVRDCDFHSCSGANVRIVSPTSVGQPNLSFWNNLTDTPYLGGSEAIYQVSACDTASFINLENLKIVNVPLISLVSVFNFRVIACKGEACEYDNVSSGSNPAIVLANSYGSIDIRLNGVTVGAGAVPSSVVSVQNGAIGQSVIIENMSVGFTAGTGTLDLVQGNLININFIGSPNIIGLGSGPAVCNFMNTAGGFNTGKVLQFATPPGGAMSDDIGDNSYTWAGQTSPVILVFNTPLTAARTVTLPTGTGNVGANNCWNGAQVTVVRTANATGAFNLTINGTNPATKIVAIGAWATFAWRLSLQWVEIASGTL